MSSYTGLRLDLGVAAAIAMITWLVFRQVTSFYFSSLDAETITANDMVGNGLTWLGFHVAFTDSRLGSWVPFAWISHMLDVQWYGLDPAAHHRTSLLIHSFNAALAFTVFRLLSVTTWPSALAALLFALHPLRVESVAWIPARQTLLGGLFGFSAIAAWVRSRDAGGKAMYWFAVVCAFSAVLSTPAAAVLPAILLLVAPGPVIAPMLAVSALAVVMWLARGGFQGLGLSVPSAFLPALLHTVWPAHLTPVGEQGHVLGAVVLFLLLGGAFALRERMPRVYQGLLWFCAALLAVLLLAEAGRHSYADRFTYFAHAGLAMALVFGAHALLGSAATHPAVIAPACLLVIACAWQSWVHTGYWSADVLLFQRAIDLNPSNQKAISLLGSALVRNQQPALALPYLKKAAELDSKSAAARLNLAEAHYMAGDNTASLAEIDTALRLDPRSGRFHAHRGTVLRAAGKPEEAMVEYQKALDLGLTREVKLQSLLNMGLIENKLGNFVSAVKYFQLGLQEEPTFFLARKNLAFAYLRMRMHTEAMAEFEKLFVTNPEDDDVQKALRYLRHEKK